MKDLYEWMSEDQLLIDWLHGSHHVPPVKPCGKGITINVSTGRLSTFDFNELTTLVLLSHDRCVRAEIQSSGPGKVKVVLHRRHGRDGMMWDKHPTIEQALNDFSTWGERIGGN